MTAARTTRQVLAAIGCPHLTLHNGKGYWYFCYDDVAANKYETNSIYEMYLSHMSLEQWVEEGRDLVAKMEQAA